MFGRNPTRKAEHALPGTSLAVHSIFNTIQGEGPYAGRVATFVRLWGCHLQCPACDTDFESARNDMPIGAIVKRCLDNAPAHLVVLTGGEPMRQNIGPLTHALTAADRLVQVETAGSFYYEGIEAQFVVSPKTPRVHPTLALRATAWKYIVGAGMEIDELDGLPVTGDLMTGSRHRIARPPVADLRRMRARIYLQPLDEQSAVKNAENVQACVRLCLKYGYSLSLQQHKIVGLE